MRDYPEIPERIRVTQTNPECTTAPTSAQFQGYEGMSVQLCPASKPWPEDYKFDNPEAVIEFAKAMGLIDDVRERMYGVYCDQKHMVLGYRLVSAGGIAETLIDPKVMFQPAMALGAIELFIVHNHPSGNPRPSPADHAITKRLATVAAVLGVRLVDHIVVGREGTWSYSDNKPDALKSAIT